jgi:hypothetical protein
MAGITVAGPMPRMTPAYLHALAAQLRSPIAAAAAELARSEFPE